MKGQPVFVDGCVLFVVPVLALSRAPARGRHTASAQTLVASLHPLIAHHAVCPHCGRVRSERRSVRSERRSVRSEWSSRASVCACAVVCRRAARAA
eukprot:6213420-Pleurochrysis_carterae.AAC.3